MVSAPPAKDVAIVAFGREVRRRRTAVGLTLEALSEAAGLTPNYISAIELGKRDPSFSSMQAIARGLGAPLGELLGLPDVSAEAIEAWRLLCALPVNPRNAALGLLRSLAAWGGAASGDRGAGLRP
jgi:transcriptional regulator with XRE-family HTH domain